MYTIENLIEDPYPAPTGGSVSPAAKGLPLERVLFALAGTVTLGSALLAAAFSSWFLLLAVFVGVNQWLYVLVGACPASLVLRRACRLRSAIYDHDNNDHDNNPVTTHMKTGRI